ncbi:MAG TPA: biopolymer transporter ExbD [Candidatus Eisenbacteria bacterium]|nr:biopolymer transporter ExbD [Candidatus Eisenbacteria bacterium]
MNYSLFVCLLASTLTAASAAQAQMPPMQKGIRVRLANTESALPIAAADEPNATIVTITADETIYFGINPVTPDSLSTELARRGTVQKLFIKGDGSAPYGTIESALNAARHAGFHDCVFLTAQVEEMVGERVLPKGIDLPLNATAGRKTPQLEILKSSEDTVTINGRTVPWTSVQNALTTILGSQIDRKVLVKAPATVPFEQVVHAIDLANSIGAEVILASQP